MAKLDQTVVEVRYLSVMFTFCLVQKVRHLKINIVIVLLML